MGEVNREKGSSGRKAPRPENKRVWASVEKEKDTVFEEMIEEGMRRHPSNQDIVFLSDAARSIQIPAKTILMSAFEKISPRFVMILDLIHVIESLWKAAYAFHKDESPESEQWVNKYLRMILEGKAGLVVSAIKRSATMRGLSKKKREIVDKSADYFKKNKAYMNYHEYLSLGYPIASGVIEGTCNIW